MFYWTAERICNFWIPLVDDSHVIDSVAVVKKRSSFNDHKWNSHRTFKNLSKQKSSHRAWECAKSLCECFLPICTASQTYSSRANRVFERVLAVWDGFREYCGESTGHSSTGIQAANEVVQPESGGFQNGTYWQKRCQFRNLKDLKFTSRLDRRDPCASALLRNKKSSSLVRK